MQTEFEPIFRGKSNFEYKFGRSIPLIDGMRLLADYLGGLRRALSNERLRREAISALSAWEAYVLGMRFSLLELAKENDMTSYCRPELNGTQRAAVVDSIRKAVAEPGALENIPDDLLLPILHCLTGRTGDLIRHVTVSANRRATD